MSRSQSFDTKYLKNGDRYELGPREDFSESSHGLSIGTVRFDIGWPRGVKNGGHIFDVKYVKNGNTYDVVRNGHCRHWPWTFFG